MDPRSEGHDGTCKEIARVFKIFENHIQPQNESLYDDKTIIIK